MKCLPQIRVPNTNVAPSEFSDRFKELYEFSQSLPDAQICAHFEWCRAQNPWDDLPSKNPTLAKTSGRAICQWAEIARACTEPSEFAWFMKCRQRANYQNALFIFQHCSASILKMGLVNHFITNPDVILKYPDANVVFSYYVSEDCGAGVFKPSRPDRIYLNIADYAEVFAEKPMELDRIISHEVTHLLRKMEGRSMLPFSEKVFNRRESSARRAEVHFSDPQNRDDALEAFYHRAHGGEFTPPSTSDENA